MADLMDCTCDSVIGNSFIANVNLLASQFGTLQQILEVPSDVKAIQDQIKDTELTIERIEQQTLELKEETDRNVQKSESIMVSTGNIKNDTVGIHAKTLDILERCRRYLHDVTVQVTNFEADMVLAEGVSNGESVITCPEDICPGFILTIKGFRYPVGRNTLLVSCDGVEYYRWIHFEEVGPKGTVSSMVKINVPISKGSVLRFYNISSSMAETAFVRAKELKLEIDKVYKKIAADVQTVIRAKEIVQDGVATLNATKLQIKDYVDRYLGKCNGIVVITDKTDIPPTDCLFICNDLAPRISCVIGPQCGNTCSGKPLYSEGSICGTISRQRESGREYQSGCFEINYNRKPC